MEKEQVTYTLTLDINHPHPVTAFALQIGGWMPLYLVSASMLLVDRNIVGMAEKILSGSCRKDVEANQWWLEFINSSSVKLNPILCAMEGNSQSVPTYNEFVEQFNKSSKILKQAFHNAQVIEYTDIHYNAAYDLITELSKRHAAEQNFLVNVVPLIIHRYKEHELQKIEEKILKQASKSEIAEISFVLLAVISCLYEEKNGGGPRIGRKIIKPSKIYTKDMAHNALSDLRSLELLISVNTLNNKNIAFCTRDKNLTAFWCGIQNMNAHRVEDNVTFNFEPGQQLFPRLSPDGVLKLAARLKEMASNNRN